MSIDHLDGVTDEDLFKDASGTDEEIQAEEPVSEEPAADPEQPRDEAGRFAGKPAEEPEQPTATDPPAAPPVDDNAAMVPSWRVREINEEKRALAEKVAAFEAEKLQWQQRQPAPQPIPEVKAEKPDPLLDPPGYEKYLEQKFDERQVAMSRELDLRITRQFNPEIFDKAFAESQHLKQAGDPAFLEISQKIQTSNAPGKALLDWYQQRETQREVGNDPNAFFQKKLDAWLADPANQAKVIERARGTATQQQPGAPRQAAPVNLPPSLTRATNASADLSADDDDMSNEGLWRQANA